MTGEEEFDILQSHNPGKERLQTARLHFAEESEEDRLHGVIEALTKQVVGLNRMVAYLLLEQGKTSVEIPYWIILQLDDRWSVVTQTNKMTNGLVIDLQGVSDHDDDL